MQLTDYHAKYYAHVYRIGHPVAQHILKLAGGRQLDAARLDFDYTGYPLKVSVLEPLVGQSGTLALSRLSVEALDAEDYLIFGAVTTAGEELDQELCRRLFSLPGRVEPRIDANELESEAPNIGVHSCSLVVQKHRDAILEQIGTRNAAFFDQEMEKLDHWAGDRRATLKTNLKELDDQIKELKKQVRHSSSLPEKIEVALANEGGGYLLLGIADTPPRPVVGTVAFNNPIAMAEKLFEAVGFRVDIEEVSHPGGRVLVFHIPPRPRGTAYHLEGAYLMRSGESLVPMSEDQLRRIFAEGAPDWLKQPSMEQVAAQDVIALLDTQSFFELLGLPYPVDRAGVLARLVQERLIDETTQGYSIRRLGALVLAKRLTDFPDISRKAPRVIVYSGVSKGEAKLDQPCEKGYAVGFQGLIEFVMGQLPQNEVIENALRKAVRLLPEITIRELVANALIHQDFTLTGMSVMIEVYADRVEISSPGEPLVPVERFIDGYQSRNERLADLMRRFAICEEKSSGIDKVIQAVEAYQLPAPDFRPAFRRTEAILYGPKSFDEMDRDARVRACYQHCALQYVLRKQMTNQSLRERFQLPERKAEAVSRTIRDAIDAERIRLSDPKQKSLRYRSYVPYWA